MFDLACNQFLKSRPHIVGRNEHLRIRLLWGVTRQKVKKFDQIVAFAEIEKFIDTPVKHYSSGMYVRLAFAVAAHLEPEILIVDEVLAVGDAEFQRKCLGKMGDVAQEGRTILFVSHNMSAILRLTERCLVLDRGHIAMQGPTAEAVDFYMTAGDVTAGERRWPEEPVAGDNPFRPVALRVLGADGRIAERVSSLEPMTVEFEYDLRSEITGLRVGVYVSTSRGERLFTSFDTDDPDAFDHWPSRPAGRYLSRCQIPANSRGRWVTGRSR
jgi:lipopolysaccharide transport system ATP-binding protein